MLKFRDNYDYLFLLLISFSIFLYFFGFWINENSAGGGEGDFQNTWRNLQTFKDNNLMNALKITSMADSSTFQSSRIPGVYIFHKFFNPFTENALQFRLSVFLFSFLVPISFFYALKINLKKTKPILIALIASLIFLSPYFRTSAIWGNEENFGLLTLILSYIFLQSFLKEKKSPKRFIYLNLICIFSSLCIYFDQKLAFVPGICFLIILLNSSYNFEKLYLIFLYILFSLPIIYLFNLWGGIMPPVDAESRGILQGKLYFQHIGYSMSIISFYLLPLIFLINKFFKENYKNLLSRKLIWFYALMVLYSIYFIFFYEIENEIYLGKGVFFKLSQILFENPYIQKIFLSVIFIVSSLILFFTAQNKHENVLIFLFLIVTSIIYWPVLQEYFDPLILILFFTFLKVKIKIDNKIISLIYFFFLTFYSFSFFYYTKIISI